MIFLSKLKIKYKIILLVTITISLSSIIFALILYLEIENSILDKVNEKILIVEKTNKYPPDFFYKTVDKNILPPEIYKKIKNEYNKTTSQALVSFLFYNIIVLVIILLIASSICLFISQSITSPIYKLIEKTKEVIGGNFDTQINIEGDYELNILAKHFNLMLIAIEETVNEVKKSEKKVKVIKNTLDNFIDVIPHIFYSFKVDGQLIIWNKALEKETGYKKHEVIQMKATDFFDKEEVPVIKESIRKVIKNGHDTVLAKISTKDNKKVPFSFTGNLLTLEDNTPYAIVGVGTNISNQLKAEQQLKLQTKKLTEAAQSSTELQNKISHEFIDSVNKILNYSEHITKDVSDNTALEDAKNINKYGLNLLKQINKLFKISNNSSDTEK